MHTYHYQKWKLAPKGAPEFRCCLRFPGLFVVLIHNRSGSGTLRMENQPPLGRTPMPLIFIFQVGLPFYHCLHLFTYRCAAYSLLALFGCSDGVYNVYSGGRLCPGYHCEAKERIVGFVCCPCLNIGKGINIAFMFSVNRSVRTDVWFVNFFLSSFSPIQL